MCGFCQMEREGWVCALCGAHPHARGCAACYRAAAACLTLVSRDAGRFTPFTGAAKERYRRTARRGDLPELASGAFECLVASQRVDLVNAPLAARCAHSARAQPARADFHARRPVIVALVDSICDETFLETVRSALLAALLAAGPTALFGLATLSHRVGLWDLQGAVTAVRHVPLAARGGAAAATALELAEALPLEAFLAPIDRWRDEIEAGLEALRPASCEERDDAAALRARLVADSAGSQARAAPVTPACQQCAPC